MKKNQDGNYENQDWMIKKQDERNGVDKGDNGYGKWDVFHRHEWAQRFDTLRQCKEYVNQELKEKAV